MVHKTSFLHEMALTVNTDIEKVQFSNSLFCTARYPIYIFISSLIILLPFHVVNPITIKYMAMRHLILSSYRLAAETVDAIDSCSKKNIVFCLDFRSRNKSIRRTYIARFDFQYNPCCSLYRMNATTVLLNLSAI